MVLRTFSDYVYGGWELKALNSTKLLKSDVMCSGKHANVAVNYYLVCPYTLGKLLDIYWLCCSDH
jgi:hypothetical protein